jgi:rsbT co-antagonist protein RsbR
VDLNDSMYRDCLTAALADQPEKIGERWAELQTGRIAEGPGSDPEALREEAVAIVARLREGLETGVPVDLIVDSYRPLHQAFTQLSMQRARAGAAPTATALATLALKEAVIEAVQRTTDDPELLLGTTRLLGRLLDVAGMLTFHVYVEGREEIIRRQNQQLMELSTPVVRLWKHIVAVPLIGTLDTARTQIVMSTLLQAIQEQEALVAIIDITGVPTVDTVVAHHLMQTVAAVRLMGADCLISGIRPPIAQTIAQLGIDLSAITTKTTLSDALREAIRLTGATL